MKITMHQFIVVACTILLVVEMSSAAPGINPMMLSRNALSQSVRSVTFGSKSNSFIAPTYFESDDIYEDGSYDDDDDILESSYHPTSSDKDVQLCSVSQFRHYTFLSFLNQIKK